MRTSRILCVSILVFIWTAAGCRLTAADPVEFVFAVEKNGQDPFAREVWADVVVPSGGIVRLPAFYIGKNHFAVRARAETKGLYRLGDVTETVGDRLAVISAAVSGKNRKDVRDVATPSAIGIDRSDPCGFELASGEKFVPLGTNLAWADDSRLRCYRKSLKAFSQAGLNWMRVWMVHWSALNLDWLPKDMGKSPSPGTLDLRVAANWDKIISLAEKNGVYLQIVLQHHGQYSSQVNPSWNDNPWNAANPGGFLKTAAEFFTSPEALKLTRMKYRYIVARWGYSPAVMAWELFNEVHWVDALRGETKSEAAVAQWHSAMAASLRSFDHYKHLITTSTENLQSAIYADMDFFQPHQYAANLLAGVRVFDSDPKSLGRPIFYGEVGDDHLAVTAGEKKAGLTIVPPIWASLMGEGRYPAQPWLGRELLETGRLRELGTMAKFVMATGIGRRADFVSFSPVVESSTRIPFVLAGAQMWKPSLEQDIVVPIDGREPLDFGRIPRIFVSAAEGKVNGYPSRVTFNFGFRKSTILHFQVTETCVAAGAIRVSVDGVPAAEVSWPVRSKNDLDKGPHPLAAIDVPVATGDHAVVVENSGAGGWFDLAQIDLGVDVPILAAIGQRSADRIAVWVWNRTGVFSSKPPSSAVGTLVLEGVTAGQWRVTWWNTLTGVLAEPTVIDHRGGPLRVLTPVVSRHAAVVLERLAQ